MSKSTQVLIFVVVVLGGLAAWFASSSGGAAGAESGLQPTEQGLSTAQSAPLDEALPLPEKREELRLTPAVVEEELDEPEVQVFAPYTTRDLRGTLSLIDEFGGGPFLESGTFGFWLWQRDEASYHEVEVKRGEWETILPSDVRISLGEVELGGRVAAFETREGAPSEIPLSGYLELEAYLPKTTILRVSSLETGTELDQVTVVVERGRPFVGEHPGELGAENMVVKGASSPIELKVLPGVRIDKQVEYFIKARGYAWSRLRVNHSVGGTYNVGLERAGAVAVKLSEFEASLFPVFRLLRGGTPFVERPLEWEREFTIEDLEPGHYIATVDIGADWRHTLPLGSAPVEVHAGGTSIVELELEPGPKFERGELTGILVIPSEWELPSFRILLRLQNEVASSRESIRLATNVELADVEGRPDAWRFHFPELIAGTWKFGVEPTLYSVDVEVTSEDSEELIIELPPPAEWIVRTVDPHTGEAALVEELRFNVPSGYTSKMRLAELGTRPGEYLVRAPQGRVLLDTFGEHYRRTRERVDFDAPTGELKLEVPSLCGVELRLQCNGDVVEWQHDAKVTVALSGGSSRTGRWMSGGEVMTIQLKEPGVYDLEVGALEGYAAVVDRQVIVEPAQFTELVIELLRE